MTESQPTAWLVRLSWKPIPNPTLPLQYTFITSHTTFKVLAKLDYIQWCLIVHCQHFSVAQVHKIRLTSFCSFSVLWACSNNWVRLGKDCGHAKILNEAIGLLVWDGMQTQAPGVKGIVRHSGERLLKFELNTQTNTPAPLPPLCSFRSSTWIEHKVLCAAWI